MNPSLLSSPCLWEKLKNENRPIFLYGTGNGADKILDVCEKYQIHIEGVFASSGFVRNRTFRSMPVTDIEQIRNHYGDDIVVLLAFGTTLDSVISNINEIAKRHTLYIPEVPLFQSDLFDREFYNENYKLIEKAESLFNDKISKELYHDMIEFRLSGNPKLLSKVTTPRDMYSSLIDKDTIRTVIDCGAYKGDSANDIIDSLHPDHIIALEPDYKTFLKLSSYCDTISHVKIVPINCAVGSSESAVEFSSSGSRGSGIEGNNKRSKTSIVNVTTVDNLNIENVDLIKYDVEGDEYDAINGSQNTIQKYRPALSISVYHRSEDIFKIPLMINDICPDYSFYLRRVPCIPAWDISFLAIPKSKLKREP